MTLVIHDLNEETAKQFDFGDSIIISDNGTIKNCIGCFACWIKTPGQCILHDTYEDMGKKLSMCDRLLIISKCVYGSYSPFVKNVIDRSIPYLHPDFLIQNGEMHHIRRYDNKFKMELYMYGENMSELEKETAEGIVNANAENFDAELGKIRFAQSVEELKGEILC